MKVIIAGSRHIEDYNLVLRMVGCFEISEVVSGGAKGVDSLGERLAKEKNFRLKIFLPDWTKYGKSAGPIRNSKMVDYADALIAIWDGKSCGTRDVIGQALNKKRKMLIYIDKDL